MTDSCPHHKRLEDKVDRILLAMEGDVRMGHRGIVPRLTAVEEDVAVFKSQRSQAEGGWKVLTAIGTAAGVVGGLLVKVLSK